MTSVEDIGYFRVTNREFESAASALNITDEVVNCLPKNAKVVEIGSGLTQEFARELKERRNDITCVSLDPTLGLPEGKFFTTHEENDDGSLSQVSYTNIDNYYYKKERPTGDWVDSVEKQKEVREKRVEEAHKTGGVIAGLVPELPFAPNSIDFIVDSWGPGLYLDRYKKGSQLEVYLQELSRVLKSEGQARIYPIDFYNEAMESTETKNENAKEEYSKLLLEDPTVEFKFYEYGDQALTNRDNNRRVGVIVRKL